LASPPRVRCRLFEDVALSPGLGKIICFEREADNRSASIDLDKRLGDASPVVPNPIASDQKPVLPGRPEHATSPLCIPVCIPICITENGKTGAKQKEILDYLLFLNPLRALLGWSLGALGGTRTPTMLLTATSRQRVYQFRHERKGVPAALRAGS